VRSKSKKRLDKMEEDEVTKLYNEASAAFAEKRFEESQEKYTQTLALCK
jgi:outer membrane protein assembly factor BamD (BamD/ComL family)